jgi:transposase-like protein
MAKRLKPVHQLTVKQFEELFPHEDTCKAYLQARRWPEGPRCPRCGNPAVYDLPSRKWHWQCEKCTRDGYRFSILVGTIFENTNKPLRDWFRVAHLMLTSKKGMSAFQIMRYMGFGSYKTAWEMCHKIRVALMEDIEKLGGIVEVDETEVSGKDRNRHWDKRDQRRGRGGRNMAAKPQSRAVKCYEKQRISQAPGAMDYYKRQFLAALAKGKTPTHAAQESGLGRSTAYLLRSQDPQFAREWSEAVAEGIDRLEDEAYRRAVEGVRRPVFHGGVKVGEITEYSDRLLIQLLRRRRPEVYSPRHESTAHVNATMTFEEAKKRIEELGLPMIPYVSDYEKFRRP